jgi:sugar phosphate permease
MYECKGVQLKSSSKQRDACRAWIVWGLAAAFFFAEYFARVAPGVMAPDLMRVFKVRAFSLGELSAFFYYAYVGMQLPVGALIDRYGPRFLLTFMAGLCGLACVLFADSRVLFMADLSRFLMGIAAAFAFVGALKLARNWFPSSQFGMLAGATQALGMIGAAVGEGPVSVLVQHFDWQRTMELIGFTLIVLALLIGLMVRDQPSAVHSKKFLPDASLWRGLRVVIKHKQCWINGLFAGFLYAPTAAFAELWGPSYLHQVYGMTPELAASAISLIFIGFAISSPMAGWVSDKLKRRKPVMTLSAGLSLLFISLVLYLPHLSVTALMLLLFLYGMSNVAVATSYAVASDMVSCDISGVAMSFTNMASVLVGALFQPLIGLCLDWGWDHKIRHGVPVFSSHDYHMAMILLPACSLLSFVLCFYLKETRTAE